MNALSFDYRGKSHHFTAPAVWNEVSVRQLMLWICNKVRFDMEDEEKLALAVPIFYNIPAQVFTAIKEYQRLQIAPKLSKLVTENTLDKWVIKSFNLYLRKYYGPADKLSNLTAQEFFNICEPLYWQFKQTANEDTLNALCAVLYRPKRKGLIDDDIREDVTDAGIGRRAGLFKKLSLTYKLAIAFNYEGCRNFIVNQPRYAKAFENKGKSKKGGDVTLALAGGPLGDHATTKRTNLYTFLMHLVDLIEQEEEFKRKYA